MIKKLIESIIQNKNDKMIVSSSMFRSEYCDAIKKINDNPELMKNVKNSTDYRKLVEKLAKGE